MLYLFDTGLLIRLAGLDPKVFINDAQFFREFKGSVAENYVACTLRQLQGRSPYYWVSEGKAEIDYLLELGETCIPIELKSGVQTKAKSLAVFKKLYHLKIRVRISELNLKMTGDLLNIPIFMLPLVTD